MNKKFLMSELSHFPGSSATETSPLLHHKSSSQYNYYFQHFCPTISKFFLIDPDQLDGENLPRKDH